MNFKLWLYTVENLAGPGDGPDSHPFDLERMNLDISEKGAGAFKRTGDDPPKPGKTATEKYLPPEYRKKMKRK